MQRHVTQPELILALDVPALADAKALLPRLPPELVYVKVGLELFTREGPEAVRALTERRKRVFLDLKLHDIPNTVARAVKSVGRLGAALLTVHASGGRAMLKAAVEAAGEFGHNAPRVIAVTTLTSLGDSDLADLGVARTLTEQALALADLALSSGVHGLVTSVHEAAALRARLGAGPILITPGIRPAGSDAGDQKRIATPAAAVQAGADFLVVGRPILEAQNPAQAVRAILKDMGRTVAQP
jgi:orotidine-5'-phosphate decarboxylase